MALLVSPGESSPAGRCILAATGRLFTFRNDHWPAVSRNGMPAVVLVCRDEHGIVFVFFRTGFRLFCRIWIGLGFEILASTGFGFGFTDFFDNFANMSETVEMTHERNSSFECYAVITHFFCLQFWFLPFYDVCACSFAIY